MPMRFLQVKSLLLPAPRWTAAAWLIAPVRSIGFEGDAELRQTMMRGLDAILVSSAVTLFVVILALIRHPILPFAVWLSLEIMLAAARVPVVVHMIRCSRPPDPGKVLLPWITDAFVGLGTLWSGLLGFGTLFCLRTNDPGLSVIAALLAMGTIGAQSVRSPGSPCLNSVQMCLIILPFTAGALFSQIPLMRWMLVLAPMYLAGMIRITRQLHEDTVLLLLARIENRDRALHCSLTGLPNRACLNEALTAALKRTVPDGRSLLIMCLDLDGFKAVNDTFGHEGGDSVLVQVARRMEAWSRSESLVARLGGDEFAVLLSTGDCRQAEIEAQRLISILRCPYDIGSDREARIGVSIGLASSVPDMDPATLTLHADMALYEAKRAGKGAFCWSNGIALPVDRRERFRRRLTERPDSVDLETALVEGA